MIVVLCPTTLATILGCIVTFPLLAICFWRGKAEHTNRYMAISFLAGYIVLAVASLAILPYGFGRCLEIAAEGIWITFLVLSFLIPLVGFAALAHRKMKDGILGAG